MNKSDLVGYVAGRLQLSRAGAGRAVDAVIAGIKEGLREDEAVTITGFGTFQVKPRKERVGRNPSTGEPIRIGPGRRVGFRVGKGLRDSF